MSRFDLLSSTAMPTALAPETVPVSRFGKLLTQAASHTEGMGKSRYGHQAKVQAHPITIDKKVLSKDYEEDPLIKEIMRQSLDQLLTGQTIYDSSLMADLLVGRVTNQKVGNARVGDWPIVLTPTLIDPLFLPGQRYRANAALHYAPETPPKPLVQDSVRRLLNLVETSLWGSVHKNVFELDSYPEPLAYDAKAYRADRSRGTKSSLFAP